MPFDGNGNWTCNFSAVDDRDANIKIEASRFDNILLADIAQSFENCLTKDTQVKPTQNFNANNYRIINVANPSVGSDAVNLSTLNTKDGTAVHKSGTETITSSKTFMATQYIGNSSITKGTAPASNTYYGLYFVDKNGTNWSDDQLGQIQMQCNANGDNVLNLNVIQQTAGSTNNAGIKVAIKQNGDAYTSAPTPTDTTSTSSSQIATVGWINSTGNNVAHLSGTETFSGNKTFLGSVSLGALATATAPTDTTSTSSTKVATVGWVNSIGNNVAHLSGTETFSGNKTFSGNISSSGTNTWSGSNTFSSSVSLGALATATAPTDTTSTSSTKVATTGWVNTPGNNVMHLTGNESASGNKTFTSQLALNAGLKFNNSTQGYITALAQNSAINIGTAPSSNTGYQLNFEDATGGITHRVGGFATVYRTDGSTDAQIRAYKPDGSVGTNASVSVIYPASGDPYATCPTPSSATDNSTKIATTEWIHTFLTTNDADAFSTWTKASNGGFGLANGLIVNWGRATSTTITFKVPFSSNTSYSVSVAVGGTEQGATSWGQVNTLTSTGFKAVGASSSRTIYWLAIGY